MIIAVLFIFAVAEAVLVVVFVRSLLAYAQSPTADEPALDREQGVPPIPTLAQPSPASGALAPAAPLQVRPS